MLLHQNPVFHKHPTHGTTISARSCVSCPGRAWHSFTPTIRFYPDRDMVYFIVCLFLVLSPHLSLITLTDASLEDDWKIDGPIVVATASTVPKDKKSFRLQYLISDQAKRAQYKLFQQDCQEIFAEGTQNIQGNGDAVVAAEQGAVAPAYTMSTFPNPSGHGQIASVDLAITSTAIVAQTIPLSSLSDGILSWLYSWIPGNNNSNNSNNDNNRHTVVFCIRMGLSLPPEVGGMEVNFRETNVKVTLGNDVSTIQSVDLEPRPVNSLTIHILGTEVKTDGPMNRQEVKKVAAVEKLVTAESESTQEPKNAQNRKNPSMDEL
ncbi:hypothetical protein IV203_018712 [Nitzschia inconspicua]|uniref:Uncharacterized protein n=1 Tax=Nitzschia inconspicua TaxID=303405 RepID=A0A9K3Q8X2_9STRA|nr:hypothetical protein IV203_018712 [Nitzschia inconspicua]